MSLHLTKLATTCLTSVTRNWARGPSSREPDLRNRKPFRRTAESAATKKSARKTDRGNFQAPMKTLHYHTERCTATRCSCPR